MSGLLGRLMIVAALCCALIAPSASPALGEDAATVPNHAIVGSVDLFGMTETEAREAIAREADLALLPQMPVKAADQVFLLTPSRYLVLDVDSMVARAYAPSTETTVTIPRSCTVSATPVAAIVDKIATKTFRARRSAKYWVSDGRLKWQSAITGRALYRDAARSAITRELRAHAATRLVRPAIRLEYKISVPEVTNSEAGRAILVDISDRVLRLYDRREVIKKYGVAVGMPAYPTPRGTFKVIAKAMNPTWHNPGSDWAVNMPAYIGPGPSNPLGTRALYLNVPGIRIHGTNKGYSIGTAASHGCVRVYNSNIEKLYPLVPVGTTVFIIK